MGERPTIIVNLTNFAEAPTLNLTVGLWIDSNTVLIDALPELAPRQNRTFGFQPWTATPGDHLLTIAVWSADDANETNNHMVGKFHAGVPDLVASALTLDPPDPAPGDLVWLRGLVRNDGDADARRTFQRIDVDDYVLTRNPLSLDRGDRAAVYGIWSAVAGDTRLELVADSTWEQDESDEHNNRLVLVHHIDAPDPAVQAADIVVTKRGLRTDVAEVVQPWAGQDIAITVRNNGLGRTWHGTYEVRASACPAKRTINLGQPECTDLGSWTTSDALLPGGGMKFTTFWETSGLVGEWMVCAEVAYPAPQWSTVNDRACQETFVLVGGEIGGGNLSRPLW